LLAPVPSSLLRHFQERYHGATDENAVGGAHTLGAEARQQFLGTPCQMQNNQPFIQFAALLEAVCSAWLICCD